MSVCKQAHKQARGMKFRKRMAAVRKRGGWIKKVRWEARTEFWYKETQACRNRSLDKRNSAQRPSCDGIKWKLLKAVKGAQMITTQGRLISSPVNSLSHK